MSGEALRERLIAEVPRIVVAAAASGAGKTTVAAGLMAAFKRAGHRVQPFKVGPDYIDPTYHERASGRVSSNLDSWLVPTNRLKEIFYRRTRQADIAIIEGVMGLFDGRRDGRGASTGEIAKVLKAPVVLVVDASRMAQSIAPLVSGFRDFDPELTIAGAVLNKVSSEAHKDVLEQALQSVGVPVLGWLRQDADLEIPSRHLGLVPAVEKEIRRGFWDRLAAHVGADFSLPKIEALARQAPSFPVALAVHDGIRLPAAGKVPIAIAKDEAFSFYYPENLELLEACGAELVYVSPLADERFPQVAGLYLGGGFPEVKAAELSANEGFKRSLKGRCWEGMPIYAECGGLIYLTEEVSDREGRCWPMVGAIKARSRMSNGLRNFGYVSLDVLGDNLLASEGTRLRGHEFHWSEVVFDAEPAPPAYRVQSLKGSARYEGLSQGNLLASYVHLHFAGEPRLAASFVKAASNWFQRGCQSKARREVRNGT